MKRLFMFMAAVLTLSLFTACNDDKETEIPRSLDDSVWCSVPDEQGEQIHILFSPSGEATYTLWLNEGEQIEVQAEYSYTYNRPNLMLTPCSEDMPTFTGYVANNGSYNTLHLNSSDGSTSIVLTHHIDKSDTIWK